MLVMKDRAISAFMRRCWVKICVFLCFLALQLRLVIKVAADKSMPALSEGPGSFVCS